MGHKEILEDLLAKYKAHKEAVDRGGDYISGLFESFPQLENIGILGYTPSFNDGDPCSHYHNILLKIGDYDEWEYEAFTTKNGDPLEEGVVNFKGTLVDITKLNKHLSEEAESEIRSGLAEFEQYFIRKYETNFFLFYERDDSEQGYKVEVQEIYMD